MISRTADTVTWSMHDFRAWVESLPAGLVVGITDDPCNCPIALWRESLGEHVSVAPDRIQIYHANGNVDYLAPSWIYEFVTRIDELKAMPIIDEETGAADDLHYRREEVYAAEVLEVIDTIKEGTL